MRGDSSRGMSREPESAGHSGEHITAHHNG